MMETSSNKNNLHSFQSLQIIPQAAFRRGDVAGSGDPEGDPPCGVTLALRAFRAVRWAANNGCDVTVEEVDEGGEVAGRVAVGDEVQVSSVVGRQTTAAQTHRRQT
eukprot:Gb_10909 [translate_table: standard]